MRRFIDLFLNNFFAERDRWFAFLPILFGTGIGIYFLLENEPSLWIAPILMEILLICAYICRHKPNILLILCAFFLILCGFADIQLKSTFLKAPEDVLYTKEETYLKGRVINIDNNYKGKTRITLNNLSDFNDNKINGTYRITLNQSNNKLKIGNCAEVAASTFPLMKTNITGGYQFDRKAYFEGINALGYSLADAYETECLESDSSTTLKIKSYLFDMRKNIVEKIKSSMPKDEAAIAAALIAGDKSNLTKNLRTQYQDSGLAHFLAISGLHMGMITFLMFFIIRLSLAAIPAVGLRYNGKKISALFAIFISFVYLLISGAEIPAQRAFIMTLVVLIGVLFDREAISVRTISLAAFVVLIFSPQALISASFQMSFSAVLLMVAFYERFSGKINGFFAGGGLFRYVFGYLAGIIISDAIATIATLPFSIYHFHRISIYTSFGNFLAGPIIGLMIMPFILLSLIALPFGLEKLPFEIVSKGLEAVNEITAYVSSLPNAGYKVVAMPFWGLILICFGGIWLCVWQKNWRKLGLVPIIVGFCSIFLTRTPDFAINANANIFAIKDNLGKMVVVPLHNDKFTPNIWLEQNTQNPLDEKQRKLLTEIVKGKAYVPEWVELKCTKEDCLYKNRFLIEKDTNSIFVDDKPIDTKENLGFSAYINGDKIKIKTVREYVGNRNWNQLTY